MIASTSGSRTRSTAPPSQAASAWSGLLSSAVSAAETKVEDWTERLNRVAATAADGGVTAGSATSRAGVSGVAAGLTGRNPVWAAVRGAWAGGGTGVRVAMVAAAVGLILVLVLSPVLLVVVLVTAAVVVVVSKVRTARR